MYRRDHFLDRDQVEDAQLAQKEAQEGMPKNVQDFKDHPYYALERHLRRSEVIHPKREVGKVATGKSGGDKALEPIYRRCDVHEVKSADKWYRVGREIKTGEQPLKRVSARRSQKSVSDDDQISEDEDNAGTALYAAFQTTVYNAPPVVNGRIPKNVYGNLDIYVPSMVPDGGVHITHPETARAAKILGIDYADAVTGFAFKGRQGTAIVSGAVVATQYREAVEEVINAFEDERTEAEEARRSAEALRMWRRLLAGLRIRKRIEGYEVEGERDAMREKMEELDEEEDDDGGGFLPNRDAEVLAEPTAGRMRVRDLASPEGDRRGEFLADDEDQGGGGFMAGSSDQGGGFIQENEDSGGDFVPEDEAENTVSDTNGKPQPAADPFTNNIDVEDRRGLSAFDIDVDAEEAMRETEPAEFYDPRDSRNGVSEQSGGFLPNSLGDTTAENANIPEHAFASDRGGGFLAGDGDDGIIGQTHAEPEQEPRQPVPQLPSRNKEPLSTATIDLGLADEDLAEARMLQDLYESAQADPSPSAPTAPNPNSQPTANGPETPGAVRKSISHETEENHDAAIEQAEEIEIQTQSPASDPGSLLSHDPEDDDADPEWLV